MSHIFLGVAPLDGYLLKFSLNSGGFALLDMKPFLEQGDFIILKDLKLFKTVKLDELQGIEWDSVNLSLSRDTIIANMY